jgi:hypothetical protein
LSPSPTTTASAGVPRITRLVLSKAAKRIIVVLLVLGVGSYVASGSVGAFRVRDQITTIHKLDDNYQELNQASQKFVSSSQTCAVSGGITCLHAALIQFQGAMVRYRAELRSLSLPAQAVDEGQQLDDTTSQIIDSLGRLAIIDDAASYQAEATKVQGLLNDFDQQEAALRDAVAGR